MAESKTVQAKTTGNAESRVAVLDERPVFDDQGVQVVLGRAGTAVMSTSGRQYNNRWQSVPEGRPCAS